MHHHELEFPKWKAWLVGIRPRTLSISLVPVLIATALARRNALTTDIWIPFLCALFALLIQMGTNLINDGCDGANGVDSRSRIGPPRMTQQGFLTFKEALYGGFLLLALALIVAIPLIVHGGWPMSMIVFLSIACSYLYSGGPYPLAHIGISDLFVLIFFGWIGTGTTYYLQTGQIDLQILVASTEIGLLAVVPHAINNLRDYTSDLQADKKTIAVRFGPFFAKNEITLLSFCPFCIHLFWLTQALPWTTLLPFLTLPLSLMNCLTIWKIAPNTTYNYLLARSAQIQFFFTLLFILGLHMDSA